MHGELCMCQWCVEDRWLAAEAERLRLERAIEQAHGMSADERDVVIAELTADLRRASRPSPVSARVVRIHRQHDFGCMCAECRERSDVMVAFVWAWNQLWWWTPWGQAIYWAFALFAVASYQ
jgi:hypothetical protein